METLRPNGIRSKETRYSNLHATRSVLHETNLTPRFAVKMGVKQDRKTLLFLTVPSWAMKGTVNNGGLEKV